MTSPRAMSPDAARLRWARRAGLVSALQAAVITGWIAYYLVETATGHGRNVPRIVSELVLFAVAVAGLLWLSRGLLAGRSWARTPTLVWNGLLAPVAWELGKAGIWWACALTVALALGAFLPALFMGRED